MTRLTKAFLGLGLLSTLTVVSGCTVRGRAHASGYYDFGYHDGYYYSEPSTIYVASAPPRPYVEVRTGAPSADYTWIEGYWHWNNQWTWQRGQWARPRANGYIYVNASYNYDTSGRYVYRPGYWSGGPRHRTVDSYPTNNGGYTGGGHVYTPPPAGGHHGGGNYGGGNYGGGNYGGGTVSGGGTVYVPPPSGGGSVYVPPPSGGGSVYVPPPATGSTTPTWGRTQPPRTVHVPPPVTGNTTPTWGRTQPPRTVVVPRNTTTQPTWNRTLPPTTGGGVNRGGGTVYVPPGRAGMPPVRMPGSPTVISGGSTTGTVVAPPPASSSTPAKGKKGKVKWNVGR